MEVLTPGDSSTPVYAFEASFDENRKGPRVELPPAPEQVRAIQEKRTLFGFDVGYPIGVPASPLTVNSTWIAFCAQQGFNVLSYKTVRGRERPAFPQPNWLFLPEFDEPVSVDKPPSEVITVTSLDAPPNRTAYSMANSFGIPSPPPAEWKEDVRTAKAVLGSGQLLIVSVVGDYEEFAGQDLVDDFVKVACNAEAAGGTVIELNLSCPNTVSGSVPTMRRPICARPRDAHTIVRAVRAALRPKTKLVAKLSYLPITTLHEVVAGIADCVDGVAGINTIQVSLEDSRTQKPAFWGTFDDPCKPRDEVGLSGIALRDLALHFVRTLALLRSEHGWSFEIIGMGGVMDAHDVRALMASGADAVQTATGAANNPTLPRELWGGQEPEARAEGSLVEIVRTAVADPRWSFRTVDGIARQLLLGHDSVQRVFDEHPEIARKSTMADRAGRDLYTSRERAPTFRERLERLRWMLAN